MRDRHIPTFDLELELSSLSDPNMMQIKEAMCVMPGFIVSCMHLASEFTRTTLEATPSFVSLAECRALAFFMDC
jgi:hypothetical protein